MKNTRPPKSDKFSRKPKSDRRADRPSASESSDRPKYPRKSEGGARSFDKFRSPRRQDDSGKPEYPRKPFRDRKSEPFSSSESGDKPQRSRGPRPAYRSDAPRTDRPDKPRFPRRHEEGDKPRFERRRDEGDRPRFDRRRDEGDKPRFERRREDGDKPRFERKREEGDRPRFERRREDGDKPRFERGREEGDRPRYSRKRDFDERPPRSNTFTKREPRPDFHRKPDEHPGLFRVYGRKPVLEVLQLELVRSLEVHKNAHGKPVEEILRLATEQHIPITRVESFAEDEELNIQGVQAYVQPPKLRDDLRRFVRELPASPAPLLLMLDGITDPHNFGAILRSADAAGVSAVIIRERRQVQVTDVVVKASAGAAYLVPIFQVVNLSQTLAILASEGFFSVAATSGEGSKPYTDYNWNAKTVLIMGAEGAGVSDLLTKEADDRVAIPMMGKVESLNVSVATGILLFEAAKGRLQTKKS